MQKPRKKMRSNGRPKKIPSPVAVTKPFAQTANSPASSSYLTSLKSILTAWKFAVPLGIISLAVGIATQINWVQLKCPTEPFFGSQEAICKDNVLRLVLGGPLVFLLLMPMAALIKHLRRDIASVRLAAIFCLLLPLSALPWVKTVSGKTWMTNAVIFLFLLAVAFVLRRNLRPVVSKLVAPSQFVFRVRVQAGIIHILLNGILDIGEKAKIYESLMDLMTGNHITGNLINIDVSQLHGYDARFAFIFQLIAGWAGFDDKEIVMIGPKDLIADIHKSVELKSQSI